MTNKDKLQTFYVSAKVLVDVNLPIKAMSLEDAITQSKELKETDFVNILGEYIDGSMSIQGVYKEYKRIEL